MINNNGKKNMSKRVIYVERKDGEYQGFKFNNYYVHMVEEAVNKDTARGTKCEIVKLKAADVEKLNPMLWLGKSVEIYYDINKRPIHISVE